MCDASYDGYIMDGIPDYDMDTVVASALRHIRAPVRGLPLLWESGYLGIVLSGRSVMGDPVREPMQMALVPQQALGEARPRLQDLRAETPCLSAASGSAGAGGESAIVVVKKRRMDDITIQDLNDSKLDDAPRL